MRETGSGERARPRAGGGPGAPDRPVHAEAARAAEGGQAPPAAEGGQAPRAPGERDAHVATKGGDGGVSPSFEGFPYPATYGRPDRSHLKRALWAYVLGHDRGWEAERKREQAERRVAEEERDRLHGVPERDGAAGAAGGTSGSAAESMASDRPRASVRQARFGVPVPERLDFHRGPDTWRDRIERARARPRR